MMFKRACLLFVIFFSASFCFAQEVKDFDEFKETMLLAHDVWYKMLLFQGESQRSEKFLQRVFSYDTAKKVDELRSRPQYYDNEAVSTVIVKFDSLMSFCLFDKVNHYQKNLTEANLIERLKMFRENTGKYYVECKHLILPLTVKSRIELQEGFLVNWGRSTLPHIDDNPSQAFAVIFENLGLYDKAWRIQMEMGRSRYYDPYRGNISYHSYYMDAANTAYRAGNKKLGWSFLINAAAFEHEKSFDIAMETAKLWIDVESGKKELPKQKILTGEERKRAFRDIVYSYLDMKAHPRAWLFIQEYKNEFDDADGLIKKVQDDWLEFVKITMDPRVTKRIVMYGVELYPTKNDPLSITIPWPFPEGSFDKLKANIREITEKIKEAEKDGLIDWYFADGRLAVKAKYISCNDENLIVERENGKKETIEIAKLTDGYKNYIYRRLAIRNIAVEDFCTIFHKWNLAGNKLADVEAKYLSLDQENKITLELKDGKKQVINLSDLNKTEQEYIKIWESWEAKKRAEAAEKIKEQERQLVELRKKLLSEVQFREWQSRDEIFRTKAKYISYDLKQQSVTIEQENGKQITIELKDLCDTDRQYLHNLLNPKLPETKNK